MKTKILTYAGRLFWLLAIVEVGLQLEGVLRDAPAKPDLENASEVRVLCLGDSITDGYVRALKTRLQNEFPSRTFKVTQLIKSAGRADEIVDVFERYGLERKPHIVIAMLGLNDDTGNRRLPALVNPKETPSKIGLVRLWQRWRTPKSEFPEIKEAITWNLPKDIVTASPEVTPKDPIARQLRETLELAADGDRTNALRKLEPILSQNKTPRPPWSEIAEIYSHLQMAEETRNYLQIGLTQPAKYFVDLQEYYRAAESALRVHEADLALGFMDRFKKDGMADDASKTILVRTRVAREKGQYDLATKLLNQIQYPERNGITIQAKLELATIMAFQGAGLLNPIWARAVMPENFFTSLTRESYARLTNLAAKNSFQLVAMQYPLKPVQFLKEIIDPKSPTLFVDNEPSFRTALKEYGYTRLFLDLHYTGRVGHMNWTSQQIVVDNILNVLRPQFEKKS